MSSSGAQRGGNLDIKAEGGRVVFPWSDVSTVVLANGILYYVPIWQPTSNAVIVEIRLEVTTAGSVGSVIRLGIYDRNPSTGEPRNRLADAGTIDGTLTGMQGLGPNLSALTPGWYFGAVAAQGAPATNPTVRAYLGHLPGMVGFHGAGAGQNLFQAGVVGALPAAAAAGGGTASAGPLFNMRVSS